MSGEKSYKIRHAEEEDLPHLYELIKKLAEYEKLLDIFEGSIEFYKSLGDFPMDEWTTYRMLRPEIKKLAERKT